MTNITNKNCNRKFNITWYSRYEISCCQSWYNKYLVYSLYQMMANYIRNQITQESMAKKLFMVDTLPQSGYAHHVHGQVKLSS